MSGAPIAARLSGVCLRYGRARALTDVSLDVPAGVLAGLIGPDGVGKSSLLSLIAGARAVQSGRVEALGGDMADARHRRQACPRVAYMPQGLGRNLYAALSVFENLDFFARLFGQTPAERQGRIAGLMAATGLSSFADRPAAKLSGGMRQKLGLCCALIHDPDLLILDEPTTGVDPLSRRQFWDLLAQMRAHRPGMSVLIATAYMEEAARFDWLAAMSAGRVLAAGAPGELLARTGAASLEEAFVALLPEGRGPGRVPPPVAPRRAPAAGEAAIEAHGLTKRFGDFTAVDGVSFRIERGEIFGFLGSNGCGKTTTMKMLTGLLPASAGRAWLFGRPVDPRDLETRGRVGYMTQTFSLYRELTVRQNLVLHARLFRIPEERVPVRVHELAARFGLEDKLEAHPAELALGQRQRLSLAVAMIHAPEMLILDEPTSGVDPVARDAFWRSIEDLARRDGVTVFISTHFMAEAERCDRVSFMHAGRVLASGAPGDLKASRGAATLEDAFISLLEESTPELARRPSLPPAGAAAAPAGRSWAVGLSRLWSCAVRETLELSRDPVRLALAALGSVILMLVLGYGISLDVENLPFAVLDRDRTTVSRDYADALSGSRYFEERAPLRDDADLDRRMRSGELSLALEFPPGFARDAARGRPVEIGAWVDGSMPARAETALGYAEGMHAHWLEDRARQELGRPAAAGFSVETRYRYNPTVTSIAAMVPAVIPLLLMLVPAMLTALSVVREKELGSIVNLYVTPLTRLEFLLGKQLPYIALGMVNFELLTLLAVFLFGVPIRGSLAALTAAAALYVTAATALGLVMSAFLRSQVAALFGTAILTIIPATEYSGMIDPVSSLEGAGAWIGRVFPTTYFLVVTRGAFSKALGFAELRPCFLPLLASVPVLVALQTVLIRKQER